MKNRHGIELHTNDRVIWFTLNCGKETAHRGIIIELYANRARVNCFDGQMLTPHIDWLEIDRVGS